MYKIVSLSYADIEAVKPWEICHAMRELRRTLLDDIRFQKWVRLGITRYVFLELLITRWSAYAYGEQGPTHYSLD